MRVTVPERLVSSFAPTQPSLRCPPRVKFTNIHFLRDLHTYPTIILLSTWQVFQQFPKRGSSCKSHLRTGNMDSPIPTLLQQQLWWILTQLPWLQPEQERNLFEYRKAIQKADENPLSPDDQTELFNRADLMQHMASPAPTTRVDKILR